MTTALPRHDIDWNTFREIVAEVCAAEPDEVVPAAGFFTDLHGDSLDLLDLGFRLHKTFGVDVQFQKLSKFDYALDEAGVLTAESRAALVREFPFVGPVLPEGALHPQDLFTIGAIYGIAQYAPAAKVVLNRAAG